jgi:hypothetical protein
MTTSMAELASFFDTTLSAGERVTVTSADATVNVGDTIDLSAVDMRVRNSGSPSFEGAVRVIPWNGGWPCCHIET